MPDTLRVDVIEVKDGDTLTVAGRNGDRVDVRLWGIDAPESSQPYGTAAEKVAQKVAGGETVEVEVMDSDPYGRLIGRVHVEGTTLGRTLTRSGYAWHARRYDTSVQLKRNEREARSAGRGLWAQEDPTPPWAYRNGGRAVSGAELLESIGWFLAGALGMILLLVWLAA